MVRADRPSTVEAHPGAETKLCPGCERRLDIECFDRNRARLDGRQSQCKDCRRGSRSVKPVLRSAPSNGNGNGHANGNGSPKPPEPVPKVPARPKGVKAPIWERRGVSREELFVRRERYVRLIKAANLALERIESRLGLKTARPVAASEVPDDFLGDDTCFDAEEEELL